MGLLLCRVNFLTFVGALRKVSRSLAEKVTTTEKRLTVFAHLYDTEDGRMEEREKN
jgi:hypothetical protein